MNDSLDNQDSFFWKCEGNKWFERNIDNLETFDLKSDIIIRLIKLYDLEPKNVVEVGAANGFRLAMIQKEWSDSRAVAIEPSEKAIEDGRRKFPEIRFIRALANDIPLEEEFDLGIVNFVLHWVDRETLLQSMAEIDRLIADGGYLIIGDFLPYNNSKVEYHHANEDINTYKQNYAKVFTSTGLYSEVCSITTSHNKAGKIEEVKEEQNRICVTILKRDIDMAYKYTTLR